MSKLYPARRIPQVMVAIGSAFIAMSCIAAVAHFGFGVAIQDRNTGQPAPTSSLTTALIVFVLAGAMLVGIGLAVLRAAARHRSKGQQ